VPSSAAPRLRSLPIPRQPPGEAARSRHHRAAASQLPFAQRRLRFKSRAEVEARFGIGPQTRIILIGSGRDKAIETWWKLSELRQPILAGLRALGVALITRPNYSMFTDEVRYNDMHAMKRIGTAWQEIVATGVPGAYHLNARTPQDYRRLAAFIAERPEVTDIAFEFKTGAAWRTRLPFHVAELVQLAARVGRPLNLVMIVASRSRRRSRRPSTV